MKTQGTELYYIDPDSGDPVAVGCVTSIDGVDITTEQNEVTCLSDVVRRYEAGLGTPGNATFGIYTNPSDASHVRLHELKGEGASLKWVIGWSDNTGVTPDTALDSNSEYDWDLPDTRSWLKFDGFMNSFPFSFAQNASVASQIGVQISGDIVLVPKSAS